MIPSLIAVVSAPLLIIYYLLKCFRAFLVEEKKEERAKERLDNYYKRNYKVRKTL